MDLSIWSLRSNLLDMISWVEKDNTIKFDKK